MNIINKYLPNSFKELSLFFLVGVYNTVFGYLLGNFVFYFFSDSVNYAILLTLLHVFLTIHNYLLYKFLVFRTKKGYFKEFIKINMVYISIYLINLILMYIFIEFIGLGEVLSYNISFIMLAFFSFFCQKYFVFKERK